MFLFIFCHFHPHSLLPLSTTRWFVPLFVCLSVCTLVSTIGTFRSACSSLLVLLCLSLSCSSMFLFASTTFCFNSYLLLSSFHSHVWFRLLHRCLFVISYVSFLDSIASILFVLFCWHCHTTSHSSTPHPMNRATYLTIWSFELDCTLWPLFYKPCCLTLFPSYLWVLK